MDLCHKANDAVIDGVTDTIRLCRRKIHKNAILARVSSVLPKSASNTIL